MDGSQPAKARSFAGEEKLSIFPISERIVAPKTESMPGMDVISELSAVKN